MEITKYISTECNWYSILHEVNFTLVFHFSFWQSLVRHAQNFFIWILFFLWSSWLMIAVQVTRKNNVNCRQHQWTDWKPSLLPIGLALFITLKKRCPKTRLPKETKKKKGSKREEQRRGETLKKTGLYVAFFQEGNEINNPLAEEMEKSLNRESHAD